MRVFSNESSANCGLKKVLLGSVAVLCMGAAAGATQAQTAGGVIDWSAAERAPQIVIGHPGTPTTARDPENVTGVGQMVVDNGGGSIGLCTGTLINPRTVLFAAHCVNSRTAGAYGAGSGGVPIGFGFSNYNLPGILAWYQGAGQHQTNTANYFYNANHVAYHPASLEPGAASFLYGDVAIASLDTAASDIPTWAMLFSALPAPTITANGTGYHVNITGYGRNGTGATGSTGAIDYRRRVAENMLGALASINDLEGFLFGASSGLPQNLYWIDFDDPRRGTPQADVRDFNVWRDNPQPKEGITAGGDSGGPLILDEHFSTPVILGVLSGGYTRFFGGAPANGYGTTSFYQPLYLYWDWIAANNPYRYVSAVAGNGDWNDASRWVTQLDPNYQIIGPNGQLVNGVPDSPGEGPNGTGGGFGQMCFEGPLAGNVSECQDIATGQVTVVARPIGTDASDNAATTTLGENGVAGVERGDNAAVAWIGSGEAVDSADYGLADGAAERVSLNDGEGPGDVGTAVLPAATLANGLPGASNFVPNNTNGDRLANIPPRYFDVTLSANGTTTLSSAVTIDRLTLAGMGAGLNITASGSLFSNIDITQLTGTLNVDGQLRTPGDFFMMTGGLSGRGTITTPYFTNMAGVIAPGTPTTIGTLTFDGDVVLASGSTLMINLGASGASDLVAVTGHANLGGLVSFSPTAGTLLRDGYTYTFLTAQGGLSDAFMTPMPISAILRPLLTYTATSVRMEIEAGLYADVVTNSPIQVAYARLLDQNRGQYARFADLYGPLDMLGVSAVQANLEAMAPRAETLKTAMGTAALDSMGRFYRNRLASATRSDMDGSLELIGRPIEYAAVAMESLDGGSRSPVGDAGAAVVVPNALPGNMRGFIAAGYLDGKGAPMATASGGGEDAFDGHFFSAGLETALDNQWMAGVAVSTTDLSGSTAVLPQSADGKLWQAAVYGRYQSAGGLTWNGQLSIGRFDVETLRMVQVGPDLFTLRTEDEADVIAGEIGVGYRVAREGFVMTPGASLRASRIAYGDTVESGAGPALTYNREDAKSLEGRIGASVTSTSGTFRPWFTAHLVHAFEDQPTAFGANFVGGTGPDVLFALASDDKDWAEVGFGVDMVRDNWSLTVAAESTLMREDVESQTYRAAFAFRF
jgi:uncharacterized protein YhjY with autotransporter beta-barrel domain